MVLNLNGAVSLCKIPNYESLTLIIPEFAVSDLHFAMVYGLRTDLGGCKIPKFWGEDAALCVEVRTNVVCPCCPPATAMVWLRPWVIEIDLRCYMYDQSEM